MSRREKARELGSRRQKTRDRGWSSFRFDPDRRDSENVVSAFGELRFEDEWGYEIQTWDGGLGGDDGIDFFVELLEPERSRLGKIVGLDVKTSRKRMRWLPIKATDLHHVAPILLGAELDREGEDALWVGWYWGADFSARARDPKRTKSDEEMWFGEILPGTGLVSYNLPRKFLRDPKELEAIIVRKGGGQLTLF